MMKKIWLPALLMLLAAPSAFAQADSKPMVGHFAAGWVEPQDKAADAVDPGWNFSGGATMYPEARSPLGIRLDFAYNWFWATRQTIESANSGSLARIDDGFASMWTVSLDAIYDFSRTHHGKVGGYFGVGTGMYTRYWQLSTTSLTGGIWCDPWTGWCYPGTVAGQVIADSDRLTKIGFDAVAAMSFPMPSGGQLYLEASYKYMNTSPATTYIPILLGYRW